MFLFHKLLLCFRVIYAIIPAVLINIVIHDIQMIRLLIKASLQARMSQNANHYNQTIIIKKKRNNYLD